MLFQERESRLINSRLMLLRVGLLNHRFVKDFSSIMAPLIKCMKNGSFKPLNQSKRSFIQLLSWLFPHLSSYLRLSVVLVGLGLVRYLLKPSMLYPVLVKG